MLFQIARMTTRVVLNREDDARVLFYIARTIRVVVNREDDACCCKSRGRRVLLLIARTTRVVLNREDDARVLF